MNFAQLLCSCVALAAATFSLGQTTTAVVFTEMGEKFTLYLNGVQQNQEPSANVRLENLEGEFFIARIDFEDNALGDFSHNNFAVQPGRLNNYMIKQNRKGKYVLRWFEGGAMPAPPAAPAAETAPAAPAQPATSTTMTTKTGGTTVGTTMTTTTTKTQNGTAEEVKVKMEVGGVGIDVDMVIPDLGGMDTEVITESTFTETTTTTTSDTATAPAPSIVPDCSMGNVDFSQLQNSIRGKTFEDSKETLARQAIASKCPTSAQVRDLMLLFDFEETKLEFAKYAYSKVTDQANFYLVNDAFNFELTIDELNEFIQNK